MSKAGLRGFHQASFALIMVFGILHAISALASPGDILSSFAAPCDSPGDLAWDGSHLWLLDSETKVLYVLDPETGAVVREVAIDLAQPRGIASDGSRLWVLDEAERVLRQFDPTREEEHHSVPAPGTSDGPSASRLSGLAWDGTYLWIGTIAGWSSRIHQCDPATGEVKRWHFSTGYPIALEADGQHLWTATFSTGGDRGRIFQYEFATGAYDSHFEAPGHRPVGLAHDGTTLWCVDSGLRRIFRLALD